jgi:phosphonate transport system substrate-binding protein
MPVGRMRVSTTILSASLMALTVAMLFWLGHNPQAPAGPEPSMAGSASNPSHENTLHLGLIPERDIFDQRRRYRILADYLSASLGRSVTLVTSNTYHGALEDMAEGRIDAAFMGSLVAALALDHLQARVLVKPEDPDGVTVYRGVIFVRDDAPIQRLEDLAGRSLAMVRTTTAGHLFPIHALTRLGLFAGQDPVAVRWAGTHDRVIQDVYDGEVDAGAAKDLRIDAFEQAHEGYRFRRLAVSEAVPNNALIVRGDMDSELVSRLGQTLLAMHENQRGREALAGFGAQRFVPCAAEEYQPVYDMAESLGPGWGLVEAPGKTSGQADEPAAKQPIVNHPGGSAGPGGP